MKGALFSQRTKVPLTWLDILGGFPGSLQPIPKNSENNAVESERFMALTFTVDAASYRRRRGAAIAVASRPIDRQTQRRGLGTAL